MPTLLKEDIHTEVMSPFQRITEEKKKKKKAQAITSFKGILIPAGVPG